MKVPFYRSLVLINAVVMFAAATANVVFAAGNHGGKEHDHNSPSAISSQKKTEALERVVAFKDWTEHYKATKQAKNKSALHAQGKALLQQRRAAMSELVKADPALALASALSEEQREGLPQDVLDELEKPVSGVGDLSVLVFCPGPDGSIRPIERRVTLNGKTYPAHVYGRRAGQTTKQGIPLSGIVVDGVLALDESPVKVLESAKVRRPIRAARGGNRFQAAGQSEITAEVGGEVYRFNSRAHLNEIKAELESSEAGYGPKPKKSAGYILAGDSVSIGTGGVAGSPGANPPTAWTTGEKKVLIIRVDFSDLPGDPQFFGIVCTEPYVRGIADDLVKPFYATSSYGQTTLSNVVTTQLYRLPNPSTTYSATFDVDTLHADARALAAADYTLADYDRICVVFTFIQDFGFGGLAQLGGPNLWVNGEFDFRVYSHELGHTYGLLHAGLLQVTDNNPISPAGTIIEYGDDYDTMGANFADDLRTDFNPYYKNMLGWLRDDQVQTVDITPATYRIRTFDGINSVEAPNAPLLALKIVKDATKSYWVGIRNNFTDNPFMENGAYVIWGYNQAGAGGGGGFQSALLDMATPGTSIVDSPLAIGNSFTDASIGIVMQPSVKGGNSPDNYVDILINGGAPTLPGPRLVLVTNYVSGGNGNGFIDVNECNNLDLVVTNGGTVDATTVKATVTTTTPGVSIGVRTANFPDLPVAAGATNTFPITISTAPFFICGTPITLEVLLKCDQNTTTNTIVLSTGSSGIPVRFDNNTPAFIRDNDITGTNSFITVSNITSAVNKVTVSMFLTHTFDSDIYFELVGPDGTTVMLSDHNGGGADNYGASCAPENFRTTFDDAAPGTITGGVAPFVGSYQPQEPLSVFVGKYGTNVNGLWRLHVVDDVGLDVGFLQCWSLNITVADCVDGGGTCPGADLALGLKDLPDPCFVGSNLVYTISVTNNGPSEAKGVIVNQSLPASVVYVSGVSSVGNVANAGSAVIANLGNLAINAVATVTVTVSPTTVGTIISTASVTATDADPDTSNNSRTVSTQINPVASDIAVGIVDSPDPCLVGGALTYTVSVTNKGPSTATGVFVTNTLPITVGFPVVSVSQGSASIVGNKVIHNVGTLTNAGRATATIIIVPNNVGTLVTTVTGKATQADPFPANNNATASTFVSPSADLALTLTDSPDPVVVNSNWIYTITLTNNGPSAASAVVVNHTLAANVIVVGTSTTAGTVTTNSGSVTASVGNLASGAGAVITVTVRSAVVGSYPATATATAAQADANVANNSATVSTTVAVPFISIVTAGATLTAESVVPADGSLAVGETVTVQLRLKNVGNISTAPLTATLLATNGVTSPSGTLLSYGVLAASGSAGGQSFSFTASGTNGGTVAATLQLFTNGVFHGNVAFNFTLPSVRSFANTNSISITDNQPAPWVAGPASPYPSSIAVTGVTGQIGKITVSLSNLSHSSPDDIDMLLVSPTGQKVLLMSDAGGFNSLVNANIKFDDFGSVLPDEGQILSANYHPADYESGDAFNAPAPASPYGSGLSALLGANQNGTWSLYIMDDFTGDKGNIANGWSISFTMVTPINQVADVSLIASVAPGSVLVGSSFTNTLVVTNAGPNAAANVVLTSIVPAVATLQSVIVSQGNFTTLAETVTANLGTINAGAFATLTIAAAPGLSALTNGGPNGVVISTASVVTTDTDPNPANNSGSAVALVTLPVADVSITQSISTNIVSLTSNVVFTFDVTNAGPNTALNVVVTDVLPAGLTFVSSTASVTDSSGTLTIALGNLGSGVNTSFTVTASTGSPGARTNTASVATASSDTVSANNSASQAFTVAAPSPSIVAVGALITAENVSVNGAVDLGETVTVSLSLQNVGNANTTNLRATLQSTSESKSYGVLLQGGAAGAQSFTFTAPAVNTGPVVATLVLKDEKVGVTNDLSTVTFVFDLSGTTSFTNSAAIAIPDSGGASPYPSSINVSGLTGVVSSATVRLNGLTHGFPDDLDILLVGPAGQQLLLMSDAGGGHSISGVTLTLADTGTDLPDVSLISSGNVKPTNYEAGADAFAAPAPSGTPGTAFSVFNGSNPNGDWSLYVMDDSTGDAGNISGGWTLTLTTISVINPLADVSVTMTASVDGGAPNPPFVGSALTYNIGVTNNGPVTATAVTVTDTLPAGLTYVTSSGSSSHNNGVVTFNIGSLASGSGTGLTIRTISTTGGTMVNTASASAAEIDLTTANNSAQTSTTVRVPVTPTLTGVTITNSQTKFTLTGDAGMSYRILASTNLTTWTVLVTDTAAANGTIKFTDTAATNYSSRYYRAERVIP